MSESRNIGPQLPPGFADDPSNSEELSQIIGPALPPGFNVRSTDSREELGCIGPSFPPGFSLKHSKQPRDSRPTTGPVLPPATSDENDFTRTIGPSLPSHMRQSDKIGPSLPPLSLFSRKSIGPTLPDSRSYNQSDDDDYVGPKLFEAANSEAQNQATAAEDFERRARKMKDKLLAKGEEVQKREAWMTELPSRLCPKIGLGPRSFKKQAHCSKDDDRSEWTDTPADKARKAQMDNDSMQGPSTTEMAVHKRNKDISETLDNFNKTKRKESLLAIHQKKKKRKDKDKPKERREFDRDVDLDNKKFDATQAKKFVDKAQLFNTKFSHGSSHFL